MAKKTTLAQRYNAQAKKLMPHHPELLVDDEIDNAGHIDDIVFRRSEYMGGMAAVILATLDA